jgi:hypothetical protein
MTFRFPRTRPPTSEPACRDANGKLAACGREPRNADCPRCCWSTMIRMLPERCWKAWRNASPLTRSTFHIRCTVAWLTALHPHAANTAVGEVSIQEAPRWSTVYGHLRDLDKLLVVECVQRFPRFGPQQRPLNVPGLTSADPFCTKVQIAMDSRRM